MPAPKITRKVKQPDGSFLTTAEAIARALNAGAYLEDAAQSAGVSRSTVYNWLARGEEHVAGPVPKSERPYVDFAEAVGTARASAVIFNLAVIKRAAQRGVWQAAAWWLERTRPDEYGRRTRSETGFGEGNGLTMAELVASAADEPSLAHDDPDIEFNS